MRLKGRLKAFRGAAIRPGGSLKSPKSDENYIYNPGPPLKRPCLVQNSWFFGKLVISYCHEPAILSNSQKGAYLTSEKCSKKMQKTVDMPFEVWDSGDTHGNTNYTK